MCGSGTFIIEAAGIAAKLPANFTLQKKGFSHMSCFKSSPFGNVNTKKFTHLQKKYGKRVMRSHIHYPSLFGFDISEENIDKAKKCL